MRSVKVCYKEKNIKRQKTKEEQIRKGTKTQNTKIDVDTHACGSNALNQGSKYEA